MDTTTTYDRRLTVPWPWWLLGLAVAAGAGLQLGMAVAAVPWWAPPAALMVVAAGALWWWGRIRVAVVDGELHVDDARLPLRYVADAVPLDAAGRRELLGPAAHPLAFVVQRPWIPGAVQVILDDPADPTPYWLVSAPEPERLAAALTAGAALVRGRDAGGPDTGGPHPGRQQTG